MGTRLRHLLFDETRVAPEAVAGALRGRRLQLAMMHAFEQALRDARERMAALLAKLQRAGARRGRLRQGVHGVHYGD